MGWKHCEHLVIVLAYKKESHLDVIDQTEGMDVTKGKYKYMWRCFKNNTGHLIWKLLIKQS